MLAVVLVALVVAAGTPGPDVLTGSSGADKLCGRGGNDVLRGLGGADRLVGDRCDGETRPTDGRDRLEGGKGGDLLRGGSRGDRLRGGAGADDLGGGRGDDRLAGGSGKDILRGGDGDDVIDSVDFKADVIRCGPGQDTAMIDEFDTQTGCESVSLDPLGPGTTTRSAAAEIQSEATCGVSLAGDQPVSGPKSSAFERGLACSRQRSDPWRWFGTSRSQFVSDRDHARALDGRVDPEAAVGVGGERTQHIGISL